MGYKYGFMDNEEYGTSYINNVIKSLATQGISIEFENILNDGVNYTPADMNALIAKIATEGVIKQTCQVIDNGNNTIKVTQGMIIFANGSTIEIDSEGVNLSFESGVKNYVYANSDLTLNKNSLVCSITAPVASDIPIAEIEPNGTITDKRQYSSGKLVGFSGNLHETFTIIKPHTVTTADYELIHTIPIKRSDYKTLVCKNMIGDMLLGHANLDTQDYYYAWKNDNLIRTGMDGFKTIDDQPQYLKFTKNGLNIEVYVKSSGASKSISINANFELS